MAGVTPGHFCIRRKYYMANSVNRFTNLGWVDVAFDYAAPQTDVVLVAAPGVGKRILVLYVEMSVGSTSTLEPTFNLKSDGLTAKGCTKYYNQKGGGAFDGVNYICEANQALTLTTNVSGNHSIYVQYTILGNS